MSSAGAASTFLPVRARRGLARDLQFHGQGSSFAAVDPRYTAMFGLASRKSWCYYAMALADEAVVVPLVPVEGEHTTEVLLRMLLSREALVIQRTDARAPVIGSGLVAQAGGSFAKALGQAVGQLGRAPAGGDLYRVILPSGAVARDLVPAVGGGFRGMVRASGSTKIAGAARLVPATVGAGAAVAAGPLIAAVGLAVVGEMLAQHQTNKKLESIRGALHASKQRADAHDRAIITTAGQETQKVAGYLLDQARLPAIAAAGYAFGDLASLTNRYIEQLDGWSEVASRYQSSSRVNGADLVTALVGKQQGDPVIEFERAVAQTYEALALRARVVLLEKIAAEFSNPRRSLPHVEEVLRVELASLANRQSQLVQLLDDLSCMQIDGSKIPIPLSGARTIGLRTSFGRMARALHSSPDSMPVLTEDDRTILELSPTSRGFSVDRPLDS